jgi:hypothetical protein
MHPLSRAHNDWAALVADARRWPEMRPLGEGVDDDELRLLLKAPVAVAWWITEFAPELLRRDHLDLLMVGVPGGPSAADEGRPYQLLPLLLQRPKLAVDATVMLWTHEARFAPSPHYQKPHISLEGQPGIFGHPATLYSGSLAQWLEGRHSKLPDLCILMHPSFDERITVWSGLRTLLAGGVRVGCFARGMEKVDRDRWLLEAHGYDVAPDARRNPWSRYHSELRGHGAWAAVGWELKPHALPPEDFVIDAARLRRAYDSQQFLQHEFEVWNPLQFIGLARPAEGDAGKDPELFVGLPDHHALSLRTGEVWALEPDRRVRVDGNITLPPEVLATYPGESAPAFLRLLWAVDVYRDEVRRREAADVATRSAAQVEHLQTQVALLLKGKAGRAEVEAFTDYYRGGIKPGSATPGSESLFKALRTHNWDEAAALIAATPVLVNAEDEDGLAPLHFAFRDDHFELARRWLEIGANPNHLDHEGFGVIHDAAKRDDAVPVELLKRYGADLNLSTGMGFTPAVLALRYGCWSVLAYLLKQGVDLRRTALAGASVAEQYQHVEGLPRILRSVIEQQLGKRRVIPLVVMAPAPNEHRAA